MSKQQRQLSTRSSRKVSSSNQTVNTQSKKKRRNNRRGNPRISVPRVHLSRCAMLYAKAKLDPFGYVDNELPCVPDLVDIPSMKFCTLVKGTAATGTGGFGCVMATSNWVSNDNYVAWSTGTAYAANTTPIATGATVTGSYDVRYPYTYALARTHRAVATALRIRYIGTELDRGGRVVGLVTNHSGNAPTTASFGDLASTAEAKVFEVNRKWKTIIWNPAYVESTNYTAAEYGLSTASPEKADLIFAFEGVVGKVLYEWELISYHECTSYAGRVINAPTKSHSDVPGLSMIRDFLSSNTVQSVGSNAFAQFLSYVKSAAVLTTATYIGAPTSSVPLVEWI